MSSEDKAAGATEFFEDRLSGAKADRSAFLTLQSRLRCGDTVVVWSLSRASRSLRDLIDFAQELEVKGVNFKSVTEQIDTTTPTGRVVFYIIGTLAEFERETIRARVNAGIASAKRHGIHCGRPLMTMPARMGQAGRMIDEGESWTAVCRIFGVSRSTLSEALKRFRPPDQ